MELEADTEHQKDDADLRKLLGNGGVSQHARRGGADGNPGEEIADDG